MKFHAEFSKDAMQIRMKPGSGAVYFWAPVVSAADNFVKNEDCFAPRVRVKNSNGAWQAEVAWKSSLWEEKKHYYRFENNRLIHWIEVKGMGKIHRLTYFSGTVSGNEIASIPGFGSVYTACPNFVDKPFSHPSEYAAVSAGNVTELWGSALNGGPLMFAFGEQGKKGWIGAGLLAKPGEYNFHTMALNKKRTSALETPDNIIGTQAVTLDYPGGEKVDGRWKSPELMLFAANTPGDCLKSYCRELYRTGCAVKRVRRRVNWWKEPIFCTWHEQVALGRIEKRSDAPGRDALEAGSNYFDKLNETNLRRWLSILESKKIPAGTIILDARWQKNDGYNIVDSQKFPDFRGLIDELHQRGYHVLLWMQAWEKLNVPRSWCVTGPGGVLMADPTHPEYAGHMRGMIGRMLGSGQGCYDADGLKIDGTNVLPGVEKMLSRGRIYGFELLRAYLKIAYDSAKNAKPDALVSLHVANPYLSDCCDMVRLGDLYTFRGDPVHTMRWRAETFRAGMPHAVIDTDGAFRFSVRDDLDALVREQASLGIPCLYQAEHLYQHRVFAGEKITRITDRQYTAVKFVFDEYRKKNGLQVFERAV